MKKSIEKMTMDELELQCGESMLQMCRILSRHKNPFLLRKVQDACVLMREVAESLESEKE